MTTAADAPRMPGDITVEWVTHVLRAAHVLDDVNAVTLVTIESIGDLGGVNGEAYRVRLEYAATTDAPRSLVAKFPTNREGGRGVAAFQRWYHREVAFYATLAAELPASPALRTPRCYAASIDLDGEYVLLLEDLRPARQGDQIAGCTLDEARAAIDGAARLHAHWWNAPPPVSDTMPETTIGLDRAVRVQGALDRVWTRTRDTVGLPARVAADIPRLVEGYVPLLQRMASAPVTVVHGDYRLDNLFFDEAGVGAIDWQFICRARGMVDIGYFLGLDLDPALRRAHERELVAGYVAALRSRGVEGYDEQAAWDDYRRALLLGFAVFLIGAAGTQPNERMVRVHEVGLARLAAAIEETEAFAVLDA